MKVHTCLGAVRVVALLKKFHVHEDRLLLAIVWTIMPDK